MNVSRKYLVAVALLAVLAVGFGLVGTVAPPLAGSELVAPQQESSSSSSSSNSTGHFQNPPSYDSGWVNITTKAGQYVTLKHNLNTTEVVVDVTGKQSLDLTGGAPAWNRTYGGTNHDQAYSIVQTSDEGYALAGGTFSYSDNSDFWLVKTDSGGNVLWNRTYGGGTRWDEARSLIQTSDGGYALAGRTDSYGAGLSDFWLVKTDSAGNVLWNRTYGGADPDEARSVVQTSDGGYALAGYTRSFGPGSYPYALWLVKTDSAGNVQWNKTYGGGGAEEAYSVIQTSDGGYALGGYTTSYGAGWEDFWLVKTDSAGNTQWSRTYGGTSTDWAYSAIQTFEGGYALAGYTTSFGYYDLWLVKTDPSGTILWNQTYGGTNSDYAYSVVQTGDLGYALAGYTYGAGNYDFLLVKTNATGNMQWNQTYGITSDDRAYSLVQTSDGGYALAGYTTPFFREFWLVKVNAEIGFEHQINFGTETGLTWTTLTNRTIIIYRGSADLYWNYVRVRIWLIKEPSWIYGDINMDGIVDVKDLYILSRNYGKTFSLLSLSGIIAIAGIQTIQKRKQNKPTSKKKPSLTEP